MLPDQTSDATKVRVLWKWLTSQNIHGTIYKLTEEFDEVEYQLQKLQKTGKSGGNTYAALFALLCAYVHHIYMEFCNYSRLSFYHCYMTPENHVNYIGKIKDLLRLW